MASPELIITGLHPEVAWYILDRLAERAVRHPALLRNGTHVDLMDGLKGLVVDVASTADIYPGLAEVIYNDDSIPLVQVLWPSRNGRFPGEPGYDLPPDLRTRLPKP